MTDVGAIGVGVRFQPLPDCRLVTGAGSGGAARITTAPGTPVHAIAGGLVRAAEADHVVVRGVDGRRYRYAGLRSDAFCVPAGAHVRAGDILGCVAGAELDVVVTDESGAVLDAVELLLGLPDPNDLGYAAAGIGVDPDALDRSLVPPGSTGA
jgi:hypothetical protein